MRSIGHNIILRPCVRPASVCGPHSVAPIFDRSSTNLERGFPLTFRRENLLGRPRNGCGHGHKSKIIIPLIISALLNNRVFKLKQLTTKKCYKNYTKSSQADKTVKREILFFTSFSPCGPMPFPTFSSTPFPSFSLPNYFTSVFFFPSPSRSGCLESSYEVWGPCICFVLAAVS